MATQKATDEIRNLLRNAKMDFEEIENKALNAYLPKIFQRCPYTDEICMTKQCVECAIFTNHGDKLTLQSRVKKSK
ncbi:MAG: hypothetical protein ABSA79_09355 [Candidatus Bathyarchaeia archaeon]|jgi:hypothetical protein